MKLTGALIISTLLTGLTLHADEISFTNQANLLIPDGDPTGLSTTIDVGGVQGFTTNITLSLHVSGGDNGDLYAYLTSDNGGFAVLLNRPGKTTGNPLGYDDPGMNVTFQDQASTDIHTYGGNGGAPLTGTWQPDGRDTNPQFVLDTDLRVRMLDSFNNLSPNGTWTLFIADMTGGGQGTLVDWSITLDTVPEPSVFCLVSLAFGLLFCRQRRPK